MNKRNIKIDDAVMFKDSVVRRCGHSKDVADMRGVVISMSGNIARVETNGTWPAEDGRTVRWIPVANITTTTK